MPDGPSTTAPTSSVTMVPEADLTYQPVQQPQAPVQASSVASPAPLDQYMTGTVPPVSPAENSTPQAQSDPAAFVQSVAAPAVSPEIMAAMEPVAEEPVSQITVSAPQPLAPAPPAPVAAAVPIPIAGAAPAVSAEPVVPAVELVATSDPLAQPAPMPAPVVDVPVAAPISQPVQASNAAPAHIYSHNTKEVWRVRRSAKTFMMIAGIMFGALFVSGLAYWVANGAPTALEDIPLVQSVSGGN